MAVSETDILDTRPSSLSTDAPQVNTTTIQVGCLWARIRFTAPYFARHLMQDQLEIPALSKIERSNYSESGGVES